MGFLCDPHTRSSQQTEQDSLNDPFQDRRALKKNRKGNEIQDHLVIQLYILQKRFVCSLFGYSYNF